MLPQEGGHNRIIAAVLPHRRGGSQTSWRFSDAVAVLRRRGVLKQRVTDEGHSLLSRAVLAGREGAGGRTAQTATSCIHFSRPMLPCNNPLLLRCRRRTARGLLAFGMPRKVTTRQVQAGDPCAVGDVNVFWTRDRRTGEECAGDRRARVGLLGIGNPQLLGFTPREWGTPE